MAEYCAICGCSIHRTVNTYARPTVAGRSHATRHHYVAERFFGRSANRPGTRTEAVFEICPWGLEGRSDVFCYECHEELLHNPVILPADMVRFANLAKSLGFAESEKSADRTKIAGRVRLLQEAISVGLDVLTRKQEGK